MFLPLLASVFRFFFSFSGKIFREMGISIAEWALNILFLLVSMPLDSRVFGLPNFVAIVPIGKSSETSKELSASSF